ncbi:PIN2/TERF1-interacting telomerase inhibitor 1-like isoform X2 [Lineus longissimus]|uniref:PIN2/TERF1-interacting telomerase inhibitor 1-like isoform X2 n=1 Tax=Lineus longissimus TaxID=88925 RepID=UPI002B4D7262
MSMLAGPRRKVKLSKDPNNLNWSNDEDKFGQRMLERMGWQKGKGLGANEDGKVDHIAVTLKSDNTGVGCTKSHADNWIAHQDDFGALLANLNANHSNTNSGTNTPDAEKVISLESHSKSAKGRVHYKKFTRSKDLSAKNTADLNCVFGRRKSKGNTTSSMRAEEEIVSADPAPADDKDSNYGVVTTTSKQSVQEYFAQKMAELKQSRDKETESPEKGKVANNDFDYEFGAAVIGSGASCELGVRYEDVEDDYGCSFEDRIEGGIQNEIVVKSKSDKKRKRKKMVDEGEDIVEGDRDLGKSSDCAIEPSKKKRKKMVDEGGEGAGDEHVGGDVEPSKKKRKKDKKMVDEGEDVTEETVDLGESLDCDVVLSKKKRKKDKKMVDEGENVTEETVDLGESVDCVVVPSKKKRKKDKKRRKAADEEAVCAVTEKDSVKGKKKKGKKKLKMKESVSDENLDKDGVEEETEVAVDTAVDVDVDVGCADEGKKKKKKKKKSGKKEDREAEEGTTNSEIVEKEERVRKTKKGKRKAVAKADVKKDGEIKESSGERKVDEDESEKSETESKKTRKRKLVKEKNASSASADPVVNMKNYWGPKQNYFDKATAVQA